MMIFVVTLFFLTLVGLLALYLYVSGVFPAFSLRPYRFAFYILLLCVVTVSIGIGFVQLCCTVL